jgi:DNA mismatch repair ATPase MutS
MAAHVHTPNPGAQGEGARLVFLYQLRPGGCPKSYGLRVASLAGLPAALVTAGGHAAARLEQKLGGAFGAATALGDAEARALAEVLRAPSAEARFAAWQQLQVQAA